MSCLRDLYGRLDKDHHDVIKEHSRELEEFVTPKSGRLLDELETRKVISSAHKDSIMVGISGSYCYCCLF